MRKVGWQWRERYRCLYTNRSALRALTVLEQPSSASSISLGNVNAVFGVSLTRALETLIGAVPVTSNAGLGANHMAVLLAG